MAETKRKKTETKTSQTCTKKTVDSKEKDLFEKKIKQYRINDEIWAIVIIALGIFFAIAVQTTAAGKVGEFIKDFLCGLFGNVGGIVPYYLVAYGVLLIFNKAAHLNKKSVILISLTFLMISIMYSERFIDANKISFEYINFYKWYCEGIKGTSGGALGMFFALLFIVWFGKTGLFIFAIATMIVCLLLLINTPISQFLFNYKTKKEIKKQMREEVFKAEDEILQKKQQEIEEKMIANPVYMVDEANVRKKKKNILKYMMDDKLFSKDGDAKDSLDKSTSVEAPGIEEKQGSAGNDETASNEIKYGIEEAPKIREGYGLSNDETGVNIEKKTPDFEVKKKIWKEVPENLSILNAKIKHENPEEIAADAKFPVENFYANHIEIVKDAGNITEIQSDVENTIETVKEEAKPLQRLNAVENIEIIEAADTGSYVFPPIELLIPSQIQKSDSDSGASLKEKAEKLEKTLHNFKVDAHVTNVTQGPAVTRYEVQPNTGVKVSSIVKLSDDIALNMEARSIRIEAPIPGKPAVGIEIENESIKMIRLRDILDSKEFKQAKSKISFAVGKDIEGNAVVADLKSMPHMLIAGSTGSGKSVCINSIIISLIYKAKPSEVKLLLIDPKVVELGIYNSIPHMMIPVVTEPGKAAAALNWAVSEMNERYKKFAKNGVRDLESYNKTMREKELFAEVMPQIVIIIDELADLMMAAPSQVEDSICRLAQMARAAGMHLIVATQRPSVDVVTGVIKANIPSRIAFAVSSQFDSRTILDMAGAEKLVGKGDMLFAPMGSNKPTRVQGNFITDEEVNAVVDFLKERSEKAENDAASKSLLESMEKSADSSEVPSDFEDELMNDAIEVVLRAEQASASMLQRRLRVGYNRAARLIEDMEKLGIIGEADGSKPRTVNFTYDEYFSNMENPDTENEIEENEEQ